MLKSFKVNPNVLFIEVSVGVCSFSSEALCHVLGDSMCEGFFLLFVILAGCNSIPGLRD